MRINRKRAIIGAATLAALGTAEIGAPERAAAQATSPPERVLGIGGFFFRSRDPQALAEWYQAHLGIDPVPTAAGQRSWQQAAGPTAFAPFPKVDPQRYPYGRFARLHDPEGNPIELWEPAS